MATCPSPGIRRELCTRGGRRRLTVHHLVRVRIRQRENWANFALHIYSNKHRRFPPRLRCKKKHIRTYCKTSNTMLGKITCQLKYVHRNATISTIDSCKSNTIVASCNLSCNLNTFIETSVGFNAGTTSSMLYDRIPCFLSQHYLCDSDTGRSDRKRTHFVQQTNNRHDYSKWRK